MIEEFEKKIRRQGTILQTIAIVEIVGGLTGILAIVLFLMSATAGGVFNYLLMLVAALLYVYSVYAGFILFKHKEKGIFHSQIIQLIQLIAVATSGFTYLWTSGGKFFVGYDVLNSRINFKLGIITSEFNFNFLTNNTDNFLYINILAIIILYLLHKAKEVITEERIKLQNYQINMIQKPEESKVK